MTICTYKREKLFGDIVDGEMVVNGVGKIVNNVWFSLPEHHGIELDVFQIMPNHTHGILIFSSIDTGIARNAPTFGNVIAGSLASIIRSFKSEISKQIHTINPSIQIWQRNYYDHIIRDESDMNRIKEYIQTNPSNWEKDKLFS